MGRKFKINKNYYSDDYDLYKKRTITINEGVTILVGCNGSGKTTLLHQIKDQLKKEGIPVISFDNIYDGGRRAVSNASFYGDFGFMSAMISSSEGEGIVLGLSKLASTLHAFIQTGEVQNDSEKFAKAFAKTIWGEQEEEKKEIPNERWILLDAVDSGLSVDNVVELKECLFKAILEDNFSGSIYIVVSANEYELCRGENCFDVYNGKYLKFSNYEKYRKFILRSREIKNQRWKDEFSSENNEV